MEGSRCWAVSIRAREVHRTTAHAKKYQLVFRENHDSYPKLERCTCSPPGGSFERCTCKPPAAIQRFASTSQFRYQDHKTRNCIVWLDQSMIMIHIPKLWSIWTWEPRAAIQEIFFNFTMPRSLPQKKLENSSNPTTTTHMEIHSTQKTKTHKSCRQWYQCCWCCITYIFHRRVVHDPRCRCCCCCCFEVRSCLRYQLAQGNRLAEEESVPKTQNCAKNRQKLRV